MRTKQSNKTCPITKCMRTKQSNKTCAITKCMITKQSNKTCPITKCMITKQSNKTCPITKCMITKQSNKTCAITKCMITKQSNKTCPITKCMITKQSNKTCPITKCMITKQSNKTCALMGDFNMDLIKYETETNTGEFYDLLCFYATYSSSGKSNFKATLIDNIFINDISCHSSSGNMRSSISDHYSSLHKPKFLKHLDPSKKVNFAREFPNLNKCEFEEELANCDWSDIVRGNYGTDYYSYTHFFTRK